jgi:hypothetical protein
MTLFFKPVPGWEMRLRDPYASANLQGEPKKNLWVGKAEKNAALSHKLLL